MLPFSTWESTSVLWILSGVKFTNNPQPAPWFDWPSVRRPCHLFQVGIVITGDTAHHYCVITKLDGGVGAVPDHQSHVTYREYSKGHKLNIFASGERLSTSTMSFLPTRQLTVEMTSSYSTQQLLFTQPRHMKWHLSADLAPRSHSLCSRNTQHIWGKT